MILFIMVCNMVKLVRIFKLFILLEARTDDENRYKTPFSLTPARYKVNMRTLM
ncbi:MAG: hypothetical protein HNEKOMLI_00035 [Sodalis sp. Psp]|nr:hypothetical protein [Sodalis sp. Psp]MCR3756542.1 hypothetical protein [Sodalis sp. Ppy]